MTTAMLSRPTPTLDAIQTPLLLTHDDELWALLEEVPDVLLASNPNEERRINQLTPKDGHLVIKWRGSDPKDVEKARKAFEDLKAQGYSIFVAVRGDKPGEPAAKFDAKAKKYVVEPPTTTSGVDSGTVELHGRHADVAPPTKQGEVVQLSGDTAKSEKCEEKPEATSDDGKKHARTTKFSKDAQEYTATRPLRGG